MTFWKPLLIILPVGLVAGIIAGQMVEPHTTLASPAVDVPGPSSWSDGEDESDDFVAEDARRVARQDRYRPDYDWQEEYQPGERDGIYSYYEDLEGSGEFARPDRREAEPSGYGLSAERAAAESAADAAELAVDEAARAAESASAPPATIRIGPRPTPSPSPAPEPRTADGDLPAIW